MDLKYVKKGGNSAKILGRRVHGEQVGQGYTMLERKQDEAGGALTCKAYEPFRNLNPTLWTMQNR